MQLDDLKILICDDSILARKQMKDIINPLVHRLSLRRQTDSSPLICTRSISQISHL